MSVTKATAITSSIPLATAIHSDPGLHHAKTCRQHTLTEPVCRGAPATCGELVQGVIGYRDFLVNCPIDRYAFATTGRSHRPGLHVRHSDAHAKVRHALRLLAEEDDHFSIADGLEVRIDGALPRGKGMASSSAELAAALSAVGLATGWPLDVSQISRLIAQIEPSDSVHLPGIAHVNHLSGAIHALLPPPQGLSVIVVDCGGSIDTLAFDRERARAIHREERSTLVAALALVSLGLRVGDLMAIADAATASAAVNQRILPKPVFEELLEVALAHGALGVNCAHSGTVLGVLHRTDEQTADRLQARIEANLGQAARVLGHHRVIGGGCRDF